jgi:hypothetical protein
MLHSFIHSLFPLIPLGLRQVKGYETSRKVADVGLIPDKGLNFAIDLIFPATLWPRGWLSLSLPSLSRLSRKCVGASMSHNPMGLCGLLQRDSFIFFLSPPPPTLLTYYERTLAIGWQPLQMQILRKYNVVIVQIKFFGTVLLNKKQIFP